MMEEKSQNVLFLHILINLFNIKKYWSWQNKNEGLRFLLESGCEHIFVCEDDIVIKDPNIYNKYIAAANNSGIRHLNFAYHGNANKNEDGNPMHRKQFLMIIAIQL